MDAALIPHASIPADQGSPVEIAAQLKAALACPDAAAVLFFCTAACGTDAMAAALSQAFDGCPLFGCTTAGELTGSGYDEGTIIALALPRQHFNISAALIPDVHQFEISEAPDIVGQLRHDLHPLIKAPMERHSFALLLCDGLSAQEEIIVNSLYSNLGEIPLFGGSAGDDLNFKETKVFYQDRFHSPGVVALLINTDLPFQVFKTQHFIAGQQKMVVTEADPFTRTVSEINAEPAVAEYARIVGLDAENLGSLAFAAHPVVVTVGGEPYVRSIQQVNEDGHLVFYCAIDEGIVLTAAEAQNMVSGLTEALNEAKQAVGEPELIIGFDCIFRRLDAIQHGNNDRISSILAANRVLGFSTYGEQFNAMHVNQTLTGVAIGKPRP